MNYDNRDWQTCTTCQGRKTIRLDASNGPFEAECPTCHGIAYVRARICSTCFRLPRACICPAEGNCCHFGYSDPKKPRSRSNQAADLKPCSGPGHVKFLGNGRYDYHCDVHRAEDGFEPTAGRTWGQLRREAEEKSAR